MLTVKQQGTSFINPTNTLTTMPQKHGYMLRKSAGRERDPRHGTQQVCLTSWEIAEGFESPELEEEQDLS